jgi:hypothetical protein
MINSIRHGICFGSLLSLCALNGCNLFQSPSDSKSNYPVTPPSAKTDTVVVTSPNPTATVPTASAVIKVPADATELSHGDYPPPAFTVPSQPGLIMVVDMDGDPTTAVASTAVDGKDAGKQMSITDVANMSITMNKLHRYRIVFVPSKGTTP